MPPLAPRLIGRPFLRYLTALAVVVAVTFLRIPLAPLLGSSVPFILYFPAVVFAGWQGGFGPGLLATFLSAFLAKSWFFEPYGIFTIPNWGSAFRLGVFLASGTLISYLAGRLHQRSADLEAEQKRLEATVTERTEHLERALKDMEAFSYSVSHDLRAPMRSILGYAEVLIEEHAASLRPDARGHLERIRVAATRLDQLTTELLALAKVSGTKIETRAIALREAVGGVVESSARWGSADVSITYEGCQHTVLGNHTLLNQVVQNLLENAVKFVAPDVKPRIRLWSEAHGNVVRLWIVDNGIGIAPADQQRLFHLLERAPNQGYHGTGIGLAIVERAVAKMEGRVGVESELGNGSRFWIELARA